MKENKAKTLHKRFYEYYLDWYLYLYQFVSNNSDFIPKLSNNIAIKIKYDLPEIKREIFIDCRCT